MKRLSHTYRKYVYATSCLNSVVCNATFNQLILIYFSPSAIKTFMNTKGIRYFLTRVYM